MAKLSEIKAKVEALHETDYQGEEFTIQGKHVKSVLLDIVSYLESIDGTVSRRVPLSEVSEVFNDV